MEKIIKLLINHQLESGKEPNIYSINSSPSRKGDWYGHVSNYEIGDIKITYRRGAPGFISTAEVEYKTKDENFSIKYHKAPKWIDELIW